MSKKNKNKKKIKDKKKTAIKNIESIISAAESSYNIKKEIEERNKKIKSSTRWTYFLYTGAVFYICYKLYKYLEA